MITKHFEEFEESDKVTKVTGEEFERIIATS